MMRKRLSGSPRVHFAALAGVGRLTCVAALLAIAGCGGEKLPTVPASGTVTYNGSPLEGATVSLVPSNAGQEGATGKGASGQTDAQGRFSLQTLLAGDKMVQGALPGDYVVTVTKMEFIRPGEAVKETGKTSPPVKGGSARTAGPVASPMMRGARSTSLIPEKYGNAAESGFKATIGPSGKTDLSFELTD